MFTVFVTDSQEGDEWMQSPTLRNVAQLDGYVEIDQPSSPPIQEQTPSSLPFFKHSQPDEEDEAPLVSPGIDEQDNEWFFTQASTRSPIVEYVLGPVDTASVELMLFCVSRPIRLQPSRLLRVGEELELPRYVTFSALRVFPSANPNIQLVDGVFHLPPPN